MIYPEYDNLSLFCVLHHCNSLRYIWLWTKKPHNKLWSSPPDYINNISFISKRLKKNSGLQDFQWQWFSPKSSEKCVKFSDEGNHKSCRLKGIYKCTLNSRDNRDNNNNQLRRNNRKPEITHPQVCYFQDTFYIEISISFFLQKLLYILCLYFPFAWMIQIFLYRYGWIELRHSWSLKTHLVIIPIRPWSS